MAAMRTAVWAGLGLLLSACGGSPHEPTTPEPDAAPIAEAPDESMGEPAVPVEEGEEAVGTKGQAEDAPAVGSKQNAKALGASVKETRTTEVIRNEVLKNRGKVRACFDALSQEEKGRGGTMTIAFKISSKGAVQEAKLSEERSTLKVAKLTTCAVSVFKRIQFPASSRGFESNVNYPFNFKP